MIPLLNIASKDTFISGKRLLSFKQVDYINLVGVTITKIVVDDHSEPISSVQVCFCCNFFHSHILKKSLFVVLTGDLSFWRKVFWKKILVLSIVSMHGRWKSHKSYPCKVSFGNACPLYLFEGKLYKSQELERSNICVRVMTVSQVVASIGLQND